MVTQMSTFLIGKTPFAFVCDTLIHEALHHIRPDWSENYVARTSREITRIIWRDRWRRLEK